MKLWNKNEKKKYFPNFYFVSGCSEPLAVGDCKGAFKKFYYNSSTGKVQNLHLKILKLKFFSSDYTVKVITDSAINLSTIFHC